uniref:Vicilin-like seed storage protein At2g18540 n=1 Tax=Diabrotica virgifera virgifera TaxID=50390 RepID=A0A6P7H2U8_DIAVI
EDDKRRKEEKRQLEDEKRRLQEKRRLEDERRENDERREKEKRRLEDERRKNDERREKEKRRLEDERRKMIKDEKKRNDDWKKEDEKTMKDAQKTMKDLKKKKEEDVRKERRRREIRNDELKRRREGRNYDEGRQICDERRRYERSNAEERRRYEERRYYEDIHVHEEIGERSYSASNNAEMRSANNGATGTRRQESFALSFRDEKAAKLFVQSEKGIRSWPDLKRCLIEEFGVHVNSAQIHKMLMTRRKKSDETVQEYMIKMREIANRAYLEQEVVIEYIIDGIQDESSNKLVLYMLMKRRKKSDETVQEYMIKIRQIANKAYLEQEVVIQYIIDGIQDGSTNKLVLYGAKDFADFKEKIKLYERIHCKETTGQAQGFRANKEGSKKNEDIAKKEKKREE